MQLLSYILAGIVKALEYKKYTVTVLSISLSSVLTLAERIFNLEFFGISYSFLMLATVLIMTDFTTGVIASRHEALKKGEYKWFKSKNISYTIHKFLSIFLLLWLTGEVHNNIAKLLAVTTKPMLITFYETTHSVLSIARGTVFFLICGREFVSVGENIEKRFGRKPYIFELFERLLDIIEIKFINKLEKSEYCKDEDSGSDRTR